MIRRSNWCCRSRIRDMSFSFLRCLSSSPATISSFESKLMFSILSGVKKKSIGFDEIDSIFKIITQRTTLENSLSSLNGLQNHFRKTKSNMPNLHFWLFGYSISSSLSLLSSHILGNLRSNSVCKTTCIAKRFNCAFRRTDSISPTAKPISKFINRIGMNIMKRPFSKRKMNKIKMKNVSLDSTIFYRSMPIFGEFCCNCSFFSSSFLFYLQIKMKDVIGNGNSAE